MITCAVYGATGIGKTSFIKTWYDSAFPCSVRPTVQTDLYTCRINDQSIMIYDTSTLSDLKLSTLNYLRTCHVVIYCVDLSQAIDAAAIEQEVNQLNVREDATLLLVGLKSDLATLENLNNFEALKIAKLSAAPISTSALRNENIALVNNKFIELDEKHKKIIAQQQLNLYNGAKSDLETALIGISLRKQAAINAQVTILEASLNQPGSDLNRATQTFTANCREILNGREHKALSAVLHFVAVVSLIALVASAGFVIGLLAGAWTGPGAFVSALLGAHAGAIVATSLTGAATVASAAGGAYSFFHKKNISPVMISVGHVAERARPTR